MGAAAQATEGSPGGRECQWVKEKAGYRTPLSLRGQFANWPWQSASLLDSSMFQYGVKENGFPRRFAPRNDSGCLGRLFLFPSALDSTLETPFPSVRTGDCLAAARSRRGSDMPPACHSLPRRRFATLVGAALRGKTSPLAPLLWELSRKRLRGRRMIESAIREKKRQGIEHHCHCEASDRRHWPWQSASLLRHAKNTAVSRRTDSHVASLNATAAYHDSLICRLVPLGGMTEGPLPCPLFSLMALSPPRRPLRRPQAASSPRR